MRPNRPRLLSLRHTPLVEPDWLAAHLDAPELRIVDARWRGDGSSRRLYAAGHLPGAVPLDWHLDLSYTAGGVRDLILPPEAFARTMERAGIGSRTRVVAYAETDYSGAARLWWALRYYGHEEVAVLNGGITRWQAEGRPLSTAPARRRRVRFRPHPVPPWLATAAEIQAALASNDPGVCIVDSRPPEQYAGRAIWTPEGSRYLAPGAATADLDGRRLRGGRIPGARHLHSVENLDPVDWTFRPPDAIRHRAATAGIEPHQRVIAYCGVGVSASLTLFALYLAGYPNLALYDASWEEWGANPNLPIETG